MSGFEQHEAIRMTESAFKAGMAVLSGSFDWTGGIAPETVSARLTGYWHTLNIFSDESFRLAVLFCLRTRKSTVTKDGRRIPPGFPDAAELYTLCASFTDEEVAALPPPEIVPASPEVARKYIEQIRETLRTASGPLASTLRGSMPPEPERLEA